MKKIFLFLVLGMLMLSGASADYLPHKVNTDLKFSITSNFADECLLSTINTPTDVIEINQLIQGSGTFTFEIDKDNYKELGVYRHNIICNDGVDVVSDFESVEVVDGKPSLFVLILLYLAIASFLIVSHFVEYGEALSFISGGMLLVVGLLYLLYDFGISYTGLKWIIVMAHWGFGLLILFKQTGDWLDG